MEKELESDFNFLEILFDCWDLTLNPLQDIDN
jgi:hypothetical protein